LSAKLEALRLTGEIGRQLLKILDIFLDYAFENPRLFELMFLTKREGARQYPQDFRARVAFFPERYGEDIIRTALDILHHRDGPPAGYGGRDRYRGYQFSSRHRASQQLYRASRFGGTGH
jgi:hypothetical protein